MSYTAGDQINRALRLIGVLAEGETPSAETSADALTALNQMIDSWNTERLSVFSTVDQSATWPAGQSARTFGPSGDLGYFSRPVSVDSAYYRTPEGQTYPLQVISDAYDLSDNASGDPYLLRVNMTHPDIELTVYPVPTRDLEIHLVSVNPLTQPATLDTVLSFPPGYLRAFTYNLALELAPEFGATPSREIVTVAATSKRNIRRINNPVGVMSMPAAMSNHHGFNINEG